MLEFESLFFVLTLGFLTSYTIWSNWRNHDIRKFWSPITFISLVFLFYTVIAPLHMISMKDTEYAGVDMSGYIMLSWAGSLVSFTSILIGYLLTKKTFTNFNFTYKKKSSTVNIGIIIFIIGFLTFATFHQFNFYSIIMFFDSNALQNEDYSKNSGYLGQMVDFCVAGTAIVYLNLLKNPSKKKYVLLIIILVLTITSFTFAGSRFRVIYLAITLITVYYIVKEKKPNLFLWGIVSVGVILIMGILSITRSYQKGIDLAKMEEYKSEQLFETGFNDARVFYSSGALMHYTIKDQNYIFFDPLYTAISMPFPRRFWPDKPSAKYLIEANKRIWGTADHGIAFMNYGDSFYSFGWIGIILNGLFLGWFSKIHWIQFIKNSENEFNILLLALFNGFTYVMISRGYLAQEVTMYFMFLLIPMLLYKYYFKISSIKYLG